MALGDEFDTAVPFVTSHFDPISRKRLMASESDWMCVAESIRLSRTPPQKDVLQRATRLDFSNYLPEDILVKVDRASMLNSLEVRAPLLDYRLIEFAFGRVPSGLKATTSARKVLLKRLCARILPHEFDFERKQGFSIPISAWLKAGQFREKFWAVLTDPGCLFDRAAVMSLLRGQDKGRSNGERLFALMVFELWRRHYNTSL
jgi:asparagine synthase (glutamine-hydrolysing)